MRDRILIYGGLAIFLGLVAFPVWHNVYAGVTAKGPNPVLPTIEKQCVAPIEYMKSSHGNLLMTWREDVVRGNKHSFAAFNGKSYTMNLTSTCLAQCHAKKSDFCDRCHNYAAVSVPCWDCHLDSGPVLRSAR